MPGPSSITDLVANQARAASARAKPGAAAGLSFADVIDAVNPLQHIPVVSWAYRALSGDGIAGAAKMVGGALFGGPVGFVLAAADSLWERASGRDAGETLLALAKGHDRSAVSAGNAPLAQNDGTDTRTSPAERPVEAESNGKTAADQPIGGPTPEGPAWVLAAARLPQDQVDLLLRSVGLADRNAGARPTAALPGADDTIHMPAVPAAPVSVLELAEAQPLRPVYRHAELAAVLAASQDLLRAYGRP